MGCLYGVKRENAPFKLSNWNTVYYNINAIGETNLSPTLLRMVGSIEDGI